MKNANIYQATPTNEYVIPSWKTSVPVSLKTAQRFGITSVQFSLPGRGGKVTQAAANRIHALWDDGKTPGEISELTGCNHCA